MVRSDGVDRALRVGFAPEFVVESRNLLPGPDSDPKISALMLQSPASQE